MVPVIPEQHTWADGVETADITRRHAARRSADDSAAAGAGGGAAGTPGGGLLLPPWLLALGGLCVFAAALYLGLASGRFRADVFYPGSTAGTMAAAAPKTPADLGKIVFTKNCQLCHQANGMGVPGQFPPLVASEWVTGPDHRLTMILLKGLSGPFAVQGATYNGAMPPWEKVLGDEQIANVLTYIRSAWGNAAAPVAPATVAAARKEFAARAEPWTQQQLEAQAAKSSGAAKGTAPGPAGPANPTAPAAPAAAGAPPP